MAHADPITSADLGAYVDDQLSPERRIAVEAYLCRHPEEAMQVMADLRTRDELRLAFAGAGAVGAPHTIEAVRRLQGGFRRDRLLARMRRAMVVALLVGFGWFAHSQSRQFGIGEVVASHMPPAYVADAVQAHRTSILRAKMQSQPEVPDYDPAEIRAETAIIVPTLPADWTVTDVQVFPSRFGPSVEMAIQSAEFGLVSLFAVRPGTFDVVPATLAPRAGLTAAYWQIGDVAYVLIARGSPAELDTAATRLAASLR